MMQRLVDVAHARRGTCGALYGSECREEDRLAQHGGVADPAVDALGVDGTSSPRAATSSFTCCRALDRVLRAGRILGAEVVQAHSLVAHWDVFGASAEEPKLRTGAPDLVVGRGEGKADQLPLPAPAD